MDQPEAVLPSNPKSSSCPSCVQLQHDLTQQRQLIQGLEQDHLRLQQQQVADALTLTQQAQALAELRAEKAADAWHRGWQVAVAERDEARNRVRVLEAEIQKVADDLTAENEEAHAALADARRELEDQTGWRRTVEARLVQVIRERDAAREALKAAAQFLSPEIQRGPASNGWQNTVDMVNDVLKAQG